MRRIKANDSFISEHSPEKIYKAVLDISTYKDWWGSRVKIKVLEDVPNGIGSKVEVRAVGGWFRCEIISLKQFEEVGVQYYAGVQKGKGFWKIEKLTDGKTRLTYSINLEPNGFIPRFLSLFMNFSNMHSEAMQDLFWGLEKYLG